MIKNTYESEGSSYENFMARAFNDYDNSKTGMHCSCMKNLIDAENGSTILIDQIGSFAEQLSKVKKYMQDAIDKFIKRSNSVDKRELFTDAKFKIDQAQSTTELLQIIERVLVATNR